MTDVSSTKLQKLVTLLKELFQLDQPDLDFGIYRIMHAKAGEVTQFLERDLLPQVKAAFASYQPADKTALQSDLGKAIESAQALGADPETLPKVKELRARIANESVDIGALENETYDHLFSFFRRYYSEGDFLAKRVYKPGVYAIPYEGEEVTLHWANKDQYYIKTSEYLRDYAFRLLPDADEKKGESPMRVHLRLVDASEGEHGNVKAAEGSNRVFVLASQDFIAVESGELSLRFEYRPATLQDWPENQRADKKKPPTQKELIESAVVRIGLADAAFANWLKELAKLHTKTDGEQADYSRLVAHLRRYTARNTFDYFIHKNLGGFLRRELDFYIKNEVMHLDDVESETAPKVEQYLSKIKVIRRIAGKIIDFLAQLENFQKKLWLKKKFVVESTWLVALSQVPDELLAEICANAAQRAEWVAMHAIDEVVGDTVTPGYGAPLTEAFLKAHPTLMVDTRLFDVGFSSRLLAGFEDADARTDGVLVHGENFQALSLLQARYAGEVRCIYIDPPYNTGQDGFAYKDSFKSGSWISMIRDRLEIARAYLDQKGVIFSSINEIERSSLDWQLRDVFGSQNRVEEVIWARDTMSNNSPTYSTNHEYVEVYARNLSAVEADRAMFRESKAGFREVIDLVQSLNERHPRISIIEDAIRRLYQQHRQEHVEEALAQGQSKEEAIRSDAWKGLYPYKHAEYRDSNGGLIEEDAAATACAQIWVWREVEPSMPAGKQSESIKDPDSPNYRFYQPTNPLSGAPTSSPKRGWAFPRSAVGNRPSFDSYLSDNRISFKAGAESISQLKYFLHEVETTVSTSVIRQYADGEPKLEALFGRKGLINNPKPPALVEKFIRQATEPTSLTLDFFAGSGTTAQSVIELNRRQRSRRGFVLIEVAGYFDSVLVPRVKKVIFAPEWSEGKPTRGVTGDEAHDSPRIVKVVRLESYEDAINNLDIRRSSQQQSLLDNTQAQGSGKLKEQYLLRYQLDVESRGSQSLLNINTFTDPTAYKLKVKTPGSDESREVNVDLLETFNWLLGLTVQHIAAPRSFAAEFERNKEGRLQLKERLKQDAAGSWWFRTVIGTTPEGRKTLVIWRKLTGDAEQDNLVLDTWFKDKQAYSVRDTEFDLIYVNGDNTLENLRVDPETWKVGLIEQDFQRLMFESTES